MVGGISIGEAISEVLGKLQRGPPISLQPTKEGDALFRELSKIDGMTAIGACDQWQGRIGSAPFDWGQIESHLSQPPNEIAPSIAARHAFMAPNREVNLSAGADQLLGDLSTGSSRAHDQYRAWGELLGCLVGAGVKLNEMIGICDEIGNLRALIGTSSDHDIPSPNRTCRCERDKPFTALLTSQGGDADATADWRLHVCGVALKVIDDFGARCKSIGIVVLEREIGELHRPIWKLEFETMPSFAVPSFSDSAPFKHKMWAASQAQHVAHAKAGLSAADN